MMITLAKHRILYGLLFVALAANLSFWPQPESGEAHLSSYVSSSDVKLDSLSSLKAKLQHCYENNKSICEFDGEYKTISKESDFNAEFEIRVEWLENDLLGPENRRASTEGRRELPGDREDRHRKIRTYCDLDDDVEINKSTISDILSNCDSKAREQVVKVEYKVKDCTDCDWTNLTDDEENFDRLKDIAQVIRKGLGTKGTELLEEEQEKEILAQKKRECLIDKDEESLMGPTRIEERMNCVYKNKVSKERSKSKREQAYAANLQVIVEELLRSTDPRLRRQGRSLLKSFWQEAYGKGHTELASSLDARMVLAQGLEGLLNVTANCQNRRGGTLLPGPTGYYGGGQPFHQQLHHHVPQAAPHNYSVGVHGGAATSCILGGMQHVQNDMIRKAYGLASAYDNIGQEGAMMFAQQYSQIFGNEFNQVIQNPNQYVQARYRSVFDYGALGYESQGSGGLAALGIQNPSVAISGTSGFRTGSSFRSGGSNLVGLSTIPQLNSAFNSNMFAGTAGSSGLAQTLYGAQQNPLALQQNRTRTFGSSAPLLLPGPQQQNFNPNSSFRGIASFY